MHLTLICNYPINSIKYNFNHMGYYCKYRVPAAKLNTPFKELEATKLWPFLFHFNSALLLNIPHLHFFCPFHIKFFIRLCPYGAIRTNQKPAPRTVRDFTHHAAILASRFGGVAALCSRGVAEPRLAEGDRHHSRCTYHMGIRRLRICLFPVPTFRQPPA